MTATPLPIVVEPAISDALLSGRYDVAPDVDYRLDRTIGPARALQLDMVLDHLLNDALAIARRGDRYAARDKVLMANDIVRHFGAGTGAH